MGDPGQSQIQTKNMSKRPLINNYSNNNIFSNNNMYSNNNNVKTLKPLLTKDKAEQMCKKRLRQVQRLKTNLYAMVLVRNTLQYVQNCQYDTVATDNVHNLGDYQPFNKKPCR